MNTRWLMILCGGLLAAAGRAEPVTIVTLGDSITKGVRPGVKAEETFSHLLQVDLKKAGVDAEVINVGIGGERTDQALPRLAKAVIARKPKLVTIMYGTNDSYVDAGKKESRLPGETYRANLVRLVKELRQAGIEPVLMTEPRWGDKAKLNGAGQSPNHQLEIYMRACRDVARDEKTLLVDHFDHWTKANAAGTDIGGWTTDQCHPNPRGHREMADLILPVLLRALGVKKP